MITTAFAQEYRGCYEKGLTVEEYVDFFHDVQRDMNSADWEDYLERYGQENFDREKTFEHLNDDDLRELAKMVIEINEG